MSKVIPFNKPFLTGKETSYIEQAVAQGKISGNGIFTKKCHDFFRDRYGFKHCFLTNSCTSALELAAMLLDIGPEDEVIVPSYAYVSDATAFANRGAQIIFCDSKSNVPNVDPEDLLSKVSSRTKAIVVIHYGGMACDMTRIMEIANEHDIIVIEDAAHSIDAYSKSAPLGSIGHLSTFSFHETKNVIAGEGGMLVVNDEQFLDRARVLWNKGTNRALFEAGEVNSYTWVDNGSAFMPSEVIAAFLYAQLEQLDKIQEIRMSLWNHYYDRLQPLSDSGKISLPHIVENAKHNAHVFYVICESEELRGELISFLKGLNIHPVFHYQPLHKSEFYLKSNREISLPNSEKFGSQLLRLPLYTELSLADVDRIVEALVNALRIISVSPKN